MKNWNLRKTIVPRDEMPEEHRLTQSLSWPHLIALGVGAIVGTGILTLTGVGAAKAGPAVILSFVIAGVICAAAALAYAEMATMYPASGSAYTYTYVVLGELLAWFVGWSLILEYSLVVSAVAVGWSGYASPLLQEALNFPAWLTHGPVMGGSLTDGTLHLAEVGVNVPAVFIIAVIAALLIYGVRESANLNALLVLVKVLALIVFVVVTLPYFNPANLDPFMPYGFSKTGAPGAEVGVMAAAAIIFFAFYGFDAIATAAEETKKPERDLSIGIVGSMLLCVLIYIAVAGVAVGAVAYTRFADSPEPLALILRELDKPWVARYLAASAVIALPTVILAFFYGQSRIFFVMARDGLLPSTLARVSGRGSPVRITLFTAVIVALLAGAVPLEDLAALANAGTLTAFAFVAICMLVMRRRAPDAVRKFRTPLPWVIGLVAIFGCAYLFYSLPQRTQIYFLFAHLLGLAIYLLYSAPRAERCEQPRVPDLPAAGDRRFVIALLVSAVLIPATLGSSATIFNDGDVSWHIATGQWILEHQAIPRTDPFSFTWAGKPWVPIEWLAEIFYAAAYQLAGYSGVAALVTAAVMALHALVFFNAIRFVSPWIAVGILVAMDVVIIPMMLARPHLLAWVLIAGWTILMVRAREKERAPPLAAALLMVVWTNLHGSFVVGLAIAAAFALEALISSLNRAQALRQWSLFGAACGVAVLVNANGIAGVLHPLQIANLQMLPLIDEWKPSELSDTPFFFGVLAAALAAIWFARLRLHPVRALLLVGLLMIALLQMRHQAVLAIVAAILLPAAVPKSSRQSHEHRLAALIISAAIALFVVIRAVLPITTPDNAANPWKLIAAIPPELRSQPVLNSYTMGGPLILSGIRPYVDGRGDMYGDELVLGYARIVRGDRAALNEAVQRWKLRWAIFPNTDLKLIAILDNSPGWRPIYRDEVGVIYVRG